jgi:basic membrane protein A
VPENKSKFKKSALSALFALTLTLTGCAELPADAPISKVDYKACVISEKDPLPSPLTEIADYAVKQAVVTYGINRNSSSVIAEKFASAVSKEIKRKCNLVVVAGFGFAAQMGEVAKSYPKANFVFVSDRIHSSLVRSNIENLVAYSVDTYEAGYLSGFLAAGLTGNSKVLTAVCPTIGMRESFVKGMTAGMANFSDATGNKVEEQILIDFLPPNGPNQPDVYISAGCPAENDVSRLEQTEMKLVAYGRDRYSDPAFEKVKSRIAATIQPQLGTRILDVIGSDLEGDFIGGTLGSFTATFGNGGLELSPEHDVNLPPALLERLRVAANDYEASLK